MTRLLHITTVPQSLSFLKGQVGYMHARGMSVHALSSPGQRLEAFGSQEGVPIHSVPMKRHISPLHDMVALALIAVQILRIRPHIVHAHTPKGGLLGMLAAWLTRTPVRVYHLHGLRYQTAGGVTRRLLVRMERLACACATRVICVSASTRAAAIDDSICAAQKITVLLSGSINGIDATNRFNPARLAPDTRIQVRKRYGIPDNALVVGFVGRLVRDKGINELVQAWKNLREAYPALHLLVVGRFEAEDPVEISVRQFLETDTRIHLAGFVTDTAPLYADMDVVALPTYREGFGIVLIEAAAMRVPSVASDVTGCVDAMVDGITGTLVPPRNSVALIDAIRRYVDNSDLRQRHGNAGRERVLRDFQQEAIWEALYQEYVTLLLRQSRVGEKSEEA